MKLLTKRLIKEIPDDVVSVEFYCKKKFLLNGMKRA